jgi:hypothetical protein
MGWFSAAVSPFCRIEQSEVGAGFLPAFAVEVNLESMGLKEASYGGHPFRPVFDLDDNLPYARPVAIVDAVQNVDVSTFHIHLEKIDVCNAEFVDHR